MDTAGVSAEDDIDGYRDLVERKRAELTAALARDTAGLPAEAVHFVAADPDPGRADRAAGLAQRQVAQELISG